MVGKRQAEVFKPKLAKQPEIFLSIAVDFILFFSSFQFMLFDQILEAMSDKATYLSKPKAIKEGTSMCILRHMSDKELKAYQKMEKQKNSMVKKDENQEPKSSELH